MQPPDPTTAEPGRAGRFRRRHRRRRPAVGTGPHIDREDRTADPAAGRPAGRERRDADYRVIFEAAFDAMTITDLDGYCVEANPAACRMYGYAYEELIGLHASEVTAPESREVLRAFPEAIAGGGQIEARAVNLRKGGIPFLAEARGRAIHYHGRTHILSVIRDITAQAAAEEQLREREEQYRSIFEATGEALIIVDLDGRIVEANPEACRSYGYTRDELIGMHADQITHREYRHEIAEAARATAAGQTYDTRAISIRKDGTHFHVDARGVAFMYRGRPHVLGVMRDVSALVRAQEDLERRVAERTRELTALLDISRNAASTLELEPLLGLILDQLRTIIDYSGAAIHVVEGEWLAMLAIRDDTCDATIPPRVPLAESRFWQSALRHGEPVAFDDLLSDEPHAVTYRDLLGAGHGGDPCPAWPPFRSYLAVPLMIKDRAIGALPISHPEPGYFTPRRQALVMAMASQIAVAIENARLYEQAHTLAALEERQRLARELHDSVSQALYGIALGARTAQRLLARDPEAIAEPLGYVLELAEAAMAEMRALIFELLPQALETEGLVAAVRRHAAVLRARHRIAVAETLGDEPEATLRVKEALYKIAQEALNNTVKHARAQHVEIVLADSGAGIVLEVRDDGLGFDPCASFPGHLGLQSMQERATRAGGTLEIVSAPGAGACVRVRIGRPAAPPEG